MWNMTSDSRLLTSTIIKTNFLLSYTIHVLKNSLLIIYITRSIDICINHVTQTKST